MQVPVFLRKDITGIGRQGEGVEVSERFAKRVLFRHGLAELARKDRAKPDGKPAPDMREPKERRRREAEALERALRRVQLTVPIHIGEDGRPREWRIDAEEVAEALIEKHKGRHPDAPCPQARPRPGGDPASGRLARLAGAADRPQGQEIDGAQT